MHFSIYRRVEGFGLRARCDELGLLLQSVVSVVYTGFRRTFWPSVHKEFAQIRGILGVPGMRLIRFWGLHRGTPLFLKITLCGVRFGEP